MLRPWGVLVGLMLLGGCAGSGDQMRRLSTENERLQTELALARGNIQELHQERAALQDKVASLTRLSSTLEREKSIRVEETGKLRRTMRTFVKEQLDVLRIFSQNEDFFDYLGAELVNREFSGKDALVLIDGAHRLPARGTLLGVRGFFITPCRFRLLILRGAGSQWRVAGESPQLEVRQIGSRQVDLEVPLPVEAGDVLAYAFSTPVGVPYDEGTGGTVAVDVGNANLKAGRLLEVTVPTASRGARAYSIGAYGLFD